MLFNQKNTTGFIAAAIILAGSACGPKNTYTITGTLPDNEAEGKKVYLTDYHTEAIVDSTTVTGNTFTFTGTIQGDSIRRIDIPKTRYYANFIVEPGDIKLEVTEKEYKSSGTPKNDLFVLLEGSRTQFSKGYTENRARIAQDTTLTREQISEQLTPIMDSLRNIYQESLRKFVTEHPNSSISTFAIWNMLMDEKGEEAFLRVKELAEQDEYAKNFRPVQNLIKKGEQMIITGEGKPYIDFTAEQGTLNGEKVSLSDYVGKGKYILVDFWASWCGPCRAEMPNIKNIYNKYKGKNFDVLSVAVWDERAETLKAVKELGMNWSLILDAPENATDLYGIDGIPHIILFGPDGTILKRGLRGEGMETAVKEALNQK